MRSRIALIVHQFLPRYSAGTEQLTLKIAQGLRARGIDVAVIAAEPSLNVAPAISQETVDGLTVFRLRGVAINDPFVSVRNSQAELLLRSALERISPDVVHVLHFSHVGVGVVDVTEELNLPLVFTATDFWWRCPLERLQLPSGSRCNGPGPLGARCLRHRIEIGSHHRSVLKWAAAAPVWLFAPVLAAARLASPFLPQVRRVAELSRRQRRLRSYARRIKLSLAPTEAVREEMIAAGFKSDRVRLLPFGIDAPEVGYRSDSERPFTIGFVGTLRAYKGAHLLLKAAKLLPVGIDARIRVYGDRTIDPEYAERLEALAREATIPVTFEGAFAESRFGQILAGLDAVVVPSLWMENRPLVLLSSLLARKPVVVTDQPGLTCEVVQGENGLVVPPDDPNAIAGALARLASDGALCQNLANHPRRPIQMNAYIAALEAVYDEVALPTRSE